MDAFERRLMRAPSPAARAYSWFKATVFALLAWNTAVFLFTGTLGDALDATAWLVLLVLFELETGFGERALTEGAKTAVHWARIAAAAAVIAAAIGYVHEREWPDAVNSALWIAVVGLLEIEVRHPGAVARHRAQFATAAATLYAGLGALVLIWWWRGEWFDAYDAALWLIALATVEINVLRYSRPGAYAEASAPEPR